jgi:hypothetical protein
MVRGVWPFLGGMKGRGGSFYGERVGGATPLFIQEKVNIAILGNFGYFVAQKVPKYFKITQNSLLGVVLKFLKLL